MNAERQQPRRKTEDLSVDWDDTVVRRPRKKAATTSTLFRNVIIGLVIVAGGLYALSTRYDLAKLLVIDPSNPMETLTKARKDQPDTAQASAAAPASGEPASPAPGRSGSHSAPATHAQPVAPSTSVALPANVNVAPVYLGKQKEGK